MAQWVVRRTCDGCTWGPAWVMPKILPEFFCKKVGRGCQFILLFTSCYIINYAICFLTFNTYWFLRWLLSSQKSVNQYKECEHQKFLTPQILQPKKGEESKKSAVFTCFFQVVRTECPNGLLLQFLGPKRRGSSPTWLFFATVGRKLNLLFFTSNGQNFGCCSWCCFFWYQLYEKDKNMCVNFRSRSQ